MKISGPGQTSQTGAARPAQRAAGGDGFRVANPSAGPAAAAGGVAGAGAVMGVQSILALQEVGSPLERRRRSVSRAGRILDVLEKLKVAMISGDVGADDLASLARAVREQRADTEDARLEGVLDEIETRAAVELAKLEAAARAA